MSAIQEVQLENQFIIYDQSRLSQPVEYCFEPVFWQQQGKVTGHSYGRGVTWFLQLDRGEGVLRHYRRGGLFGKLVKDQYWYTQFTQTRSYQEFKLLELLRGQGVNVPRPIAARAVKKGFSYRADILIERIHNARDLFMLLQEQALEVATYKEIGAMIAKMHLAGVNHTDLNIHNILLDEHQKVWLIDFDKCYQQKGQGWQQGNLNRLLRSFNKEKEKVAIDWKESDWQALLDGYQSQIQQPC